MGIAYVFQKNGINLNVFAALFISITVPLIVTPIIGWHVIGLIVKIHDLEEEMRRLANYDSLTGLLSRHAFMETG